ncbi:MAG TPA: dienelactone hydrolase family protein [Povalibacter sp.]|uniref:alpha/beta hydrolase n=1 Tax=Povalibacter sp. TaxID=1962978 RepID=UPI002C07F65B|nr:dienelactone hydrolase family protein [Povalibacter sp.]HMN47072.1 dienelactone hydrolase family protein [Povalibacter sp.]
MPSYRHRRALIAIGALFAAGPAFAQINTDIIEKHRADLARQGSDPDMKRDATQPRDWNYDLPQGVTTRVVTFYVDGGTALHGKLFLPRGFSAKGSWPAVVVGHGINALSIGIEKYAARFADRGLVAMAIDYQSYGFSHSGSDDIRLLEPDPTTDASAVTDRHLRIVMKRTNLNNVHEVDDFRAAISFLQGEPGVDAERIGIWGSSNGGAIVMAVSAVDARVKACVAQVIGTRPMPRQPVAIADANMEDAIVRVRTGQGAETEAGFSFRTYVDRWYLTRNRDVQPGAWLDQIPKTNHVLFVPAEKDELTRGDSGAVEAAKFLTGRGVTAQVATLPDLTHFQAYSYTGFEVGSTLAADWFLKYLGTGSAR